MPRRGLSAIPVFLPAPRRDHSVAREIVRGRIAAAAKGERRPAGGLRAPPHAPPGSPRPYRARATTKSPRSEKIGGRGPSPRRRAGRSPACVFAASPWPALCRTAPLLCPRPGDPAGIKGGAAGRRGPFVRRAHRGRDRRPARSAARSGASRRVRARRDVARRRRPVCRRLFHVFRMRGCLLRGIAGLSRGADLGGAGPSGSSRPRSPGAGSTYC